ncbi:MAG: NADH-quinone oxidoreductase subunit J [Bacteroidaceae bacterium]|nr:NADH-quinone oxidoreductase subunit J [Bacteroidaceae bacterium]
MANVIMFVILATVIVCSAIASVVTKSIMRAVTALLFVLFSVAGMYFLLDYTFLGTAQLSIYAGGMTMIYIFAIQLVSKRRLQGLKESLNMRRLGWMALVAVVGLLTVVTVQLKSAFLDQFVAKADVEIPMEAVGTAMVGSEKYQYVLPFEFISVFLLACIIGGLVVSRNHKEDE